MQDKTYQMKPKTFIIHILGPSFQSHLASIIISGHCWIVGSLRSLCMEIWTHGIAAWPSDHTLHITHSPRKLCHTYLKLVQMISWSRCVSACDCVMTGCCNILPPFISRPISDVVTSASSPAVSTPDGVTRRGGPMEALAGVWTLRTLSCVWGSHSRLLCWPVD